MSPRKPVWMRDLDQAQIDFYLGIEPAVAVCRGKRRHKFPGLVPGQPLSRNITVTRSRGVYQVTERCERGCGRSITYTAGSDGVPDYTTAVYGGWSEGRQLATGLGLTAATDHQFMRYVQREAVVEGFQLTAKRAAQAAAEREAEKVSA